MSGDRAYLIGIGPEAGRHRRVLWFRGPGRHRATRVVVTQGGRTPVPLRSNPPRRAALPAGLATLLVVFAGATAVSGWFAASGAVAFVGMIAH